MKNNHIKAFFSLIIAFVVSSAYQYYRSTVGEVPEIDVFGAAEIITYSVMCCLASISLFNARWADLATLGFCALLYLFAFGYYLPEVYPLRTNGFIEVAEAIIYMGLIPVAAFFSFQSLTARKQVRKIGGVFARQG